MYDQALNKEDKFDAGLDTLLTKRIGSLASLVAKEKEGGNKPPFVKLSDEFLETAVDSTEDLTNNEIFNHYMKWFDPLIEYMKDDKNAGHGFERSVTFFSLMKNVPVSYLPKVLNHIQMDSHKTQGHKVTHKI